MSALTYKKRKGTSAMRGHLRKSTLISLLYLRAKYDAEVEDFLLATNMIEVGAFGDICLRLKLKGFDKPVAVFLQAKHQDNDNSVLTLNSKNDLAQCFYSYLNVRRAFKPDIEGFFEGNFDESECMFVMYTTAKHDSGSNNRLYKSPISSHLNKLISTYKDGLQPRYKKREVDFLYNIFLKEQLAMLAEQMGKFLCEDDDDVMSMDNDLMLRFHVILRQFVVDVSNIKLKNKANEHRIASFRPDFYENDDQLVKFLRDALYLEIIKKPKLNDNEIHDVLQDFFTGQPNVYILSRLIGSVLSYKDDKLKFVHEMNEELNEQLLKVEVTQVMVDEAIKKAAEKILISKPFKVPVEFGNKDLTIEYKKGSKIKRTFNRLHKNITELFDHSNVQKIVTVDEYVGDELLMLGGGLAGAVGNILTLDEQTNLLKFTDDVESLAELSKTLYVALKSEILKNNYLMNQYRFDVKVNSFPKLTFDSREDNDDFDVVKREVTALAILFANFLCQETDCVMPMDDTHVLRYHVILVQKAIDVSEIRLRNENEEHRIASFRKDFFETEEECLKLFRDALYKEIIKKQNLEDRERRSLLTTFFKDTSNTTTLSKLIGSVVTYKQGKLQFVDRDNNDDHLKRQLNSVKVFQFSVDQAIALAAKEILTSKQFKVPAAFGNKDLTIRGEGDAQNEALKHLTAKITELLNSSTVINIVTIDESLEDELLKPSGGIGGLVGNLIVHDQKTKLLKFTHNSELLEVHSRRLFGKLKNQILNLHQYRLDCKVKNFPKLTFDSSDHEKSFVEKFFNNLLFYTSQANETEVRDILKGDIEDNICRSVINCRVTSDALFVIYHDNIQKWCMDEKGTCLTKHSQIYELAAKNIVDKPLMTIISLMYQPKIRHNIECTFKKNVIDSLKLPPGTVVVTENIDLTVAKIVQYLNSIDHVVLDLEYMLNLQVNEFSSLCDELTNTDEQKVLIFLCNDKPSYRNWSSRLINIAISLNDKYTVMVTHKILVKFISEQFVQFNNIVYDPKINLMDLTEETRKYILQNATVIFQGEEVSLNLILDDESMTYVEGEVLHKFINNESIVLGKYVGSLNYDEVKHLYVDRLVYRGTFDPQHRRRIPLMSLYGIEGDVILITAEPGMGKSTLLTHLSHRAKKYDPKVWIVRINLLDHCEEFSQWQKYKTDIDTTKCLLFLFRVLLKMDRIECFSISLNTSTGVVYLSDCTGDESSLFELKMFVHFYNSRNLIFLFDGFDEIYPHYSEEVLALLQFVEEQIVIVPRLKYTTVRKGPKLWIASGSNTEVKSILQRCFGTSYDLKTFSNLEEEKYFNLYWESKMTMVEWNKNTLNNLLKIINNIEQCLDMEDYFSKNSCLKKSVNPTLYSISKIKHEIEYCSLSDKNSVRKLIRKVFDVLLLYYFEESYSHYPLHVYMTSDYLFNIIKDVDNTPIKRILDINRKIEIYDQFIENKVKKGGLRNSENLKIHNQARIDFFATYLLGAYVVFPEDLEKILTMKDIRAIVENIAKIKEGKVKTGVISGVLNYISGRDLHSFSPKHLSVRRGKYTRLKLLSRLSQFSRKQWSSSGRPSAETTTTEDAPIFLDLTFAECSAVRLICHLLKTCREDEEKQKSIWDFIINVIFDKCSKNVQDVLSYVIQKDDTLKMIIKENETIIFELLLKLRWGDRVKPNPNEAIKTKLRRYILTAMDHDLCDLGRKIHKISDILGLL